MNKDTFSQSEPLPLVTSQAVLQKAMLYKLNSSMGTRGELFLPCIPGMLDYYMKLIDNLFADLGRPMPKEQKLQLRDLLEKKLKEGFKISSTSVLAVQYESVKPPKIGIACQFVIRSPSVGEHYQSWVETRKSPLFGSHPDAKLMAVVAEIAQRGPLRILDVGGGTGRNALPLAREGHKVDVLELAPVFVEKLQAVATAESLPLKVTEGDILEPLVRMRPAFYQVAIATEVTSHFRSTDQLRLFLAKMCDYLATGGLLLFNIFLNVEGYEPDALVRQMAEQAWSTLFEGRELAGAMEELPLTIISNESALEYERQHLPPEAWPPTSWFQSWATGRDVFPIADGRPPMELRWILCRRH
jgi:SAM-dependent methyltransferase